jgi:vacuolar-type H+-ATPase subunit C/Vma6
MPIVANDLDYLAARLHGRRSELAEAGRLEGLCHLRSIPELGRTLYPGSEVQTVVDLQRRLVQGLIDEISAILEHLTGAVACLVDWMMTRFQIENVKVLIRGFITHTPLETLRAHLMPLPEHLQLHDEAMANAESLDVFISHLPQGPLKESMKKVVGFFREQHKPFFLEAALDSGYLRELLVRMERAFAESKSTIEALVFQEIDIFHLELILRGKFVYGLRPEVLPPFHIQGTEISRKRFAAMVSTADLRAIVKSLLGRVIDALPAEIHGITETTSTLEMLAWKRFLRLANQAFRRSHLGLGVVLGYIGIRRVEVANLITLSEGIRVGMNEEAIRSRLVTRSTVGRIYV